MSIQNNKTGFRAIATDDATHDYSYFLVYEPVSVSNTEQCLQLGGKSLALKQLSTDEYVIPYLNDNSGSTDYGVTTIEGKTRQIAKNTDGYYCLVVDNSSANKTVSNTTIIGNVAVGLNSDGAIAVTNVGNSSTASEVDTIILGSYKLSVGKVSDKWYLILNT